VLGKLDGIVDVGGMVGPAEGMVDVGYDVGKVVVGKGVGVVEG